MPRNVVQDVLPPDRKSIRSIPLPERRMTEKAPTPKNTRKLRVQGRPDSEKALEPSPKTSQKKHSRLILWIVTIICVGVAFFALSTLFTKASIKISPREEKILLNGIFTASKNSSSSSLAYQIVTVNDRAEKSFPATGEELVNSKASGTIVIYNAYSSAPQPLIKNTRFETPEGLIFRISNPVTVPGAVTKNKVKVPGSVEVVVYADAVGPKYNIGLSDFTIPGFKGDSRYNDIYARSKTVMQGGFSGVMKKVSVADQANASSTLEIILKGSLLSSLKGQIPTGYVLFDDALFYSFLPLTQASSSPDSANVVLFRKGALSAVLFNKEILEVEIIKKTLPEASSSPIELINLENLKFGVAQKSEWRPNSDAPLVFSLKGDILAVWLYNETDIKRALAGKPRRELSQILQVFPEIEEARVVVQPFWKTNFPRDPSKIIVERVIKK